MLFSIIMPCCDIEPYLPDALRSLRAQPLTDFECLMVCETSADRTPEICREAAAADARFRLFTQPRSGSPAAPRNTGLDHARGEYILFLDGDDFLADDALPKLADAISRAGRPDLISIGYHTVLDEGSSRPVRQSVSFNFPPEVCGRIMTGKEVILALGRRRFRNYVPAAWSCLYRRDFLERRQLRFIPGLVHEDEEWMPRVLYFAERVLLEREALYFYRVRPGSVITARRGADLNGLAAGLRSLLEFHAAHDIPRDITRVWQRRWLGNLLCYHFFHPSGVKRHSPEERRNALKLLFGNGTARAHFKRFARTAPLPYRIGGALARGLAADRRAAEVLAAFYFTVFYKLLEIFHHREGK